MSIAKVVEITAESKKSFEDAIESGIARASKTIKDIRGAWVKEQKLVVKNGKVTRYRVDLKLTFVIED